MKLPLSFLAAIRIADPFFSNCCRRAMPGKHDGGIGQVEKLSTDSGDEQILAAAGKVGPSDASLEQDVTTKHQRLGGV